jgi:hypothetical protein
MELLVAKMAARREEVKSMERASHIWSGKLSRRTAFTTTIAMKPTVRKICARDPTRNTQRLRV